MRHQSSSLKLLSGCESISIHFWIEKCFCFSFKWLSFAACRFHFTLWWNNCVCIKLRCDPILKFLFKIRFRRETNLMQACSANQYRVIMPSWLPKVPSWLRMMPSVSANQHSVILPLCDKDYYCCCCLPFGPLSLPHQTAAASSTKWSICASVSFLAS